MSDTRWFTKYEMQLGADNEEYYGYDGILHSDAGDKIYIEVQAQADKVATILNDQQQRIADLEAALKAIADNAPQEEPGAMPIVRMRAMIDAFWYAGQLARHALKGGE